MLIILNSELKFEILFLYDFFKKENRVRQFAFWPNKKMLPSNG